MEAKFINYIKGNIDYGRDQLIDAIKTLVFKTDPELFDMLDFYDDDIFLEPLLFAYFNTKQPPVDLRQILFGYIKDGLKPAAIKVFADEAGIVDLPNIGHFLTGTTGRELTLFWNGGVEACVLRDKEIDLAHTFNKTRRVAGTPVQVARFGNPLLNGFFEGEDGKLVNIEITQVARKHFRHLDAAFEIIKEIFPEYYEAVMKVGKRIIIFEGEEPNSFATLSVHGSVFLNTNNECDEIFFIEDLVHQFGHVVFNTLTLDKQIILKVDSETPLKTFTLDDREPRTVYSIFHGIFTEALMTICLDRCYEKKIFSGRKEHELLGRLAYILKRFSYDLRDLRHDEIFTEEGALIYLWLEHIFRDVTQKRFDILLRYNTSNQPYNFSYKHFLDLNPLN